LAFEIQPTLKPDEVPYCQLGARPDGGTRLGWNSWLGIRPHTQPAADAIFSGSA
jgi:predicted component of type VI protein secretion system